MSAPRRKSLTEKDRTDWAFYARHVLPLAGRGAPEPPPAPPPAPPPPEPPPAAAKAKGAAAQIMPKPLPAARPRSTSIAVGDQPDGLDKASWNRLRSGKLPPVRTLDLHGRTVQRAFHALHGFLVAAHADRVRCVEVITGRGSGENGGAIRRELPMWLNGPELRPLVLGASYPHAANTGAVRLLIRRIR